MKTECLRAAGIWVDSCLLYTSGLAYDTIGYKKTVERIHRLEKKYNAKVLFGHDIDQYRTLKFVPEYYS